MARCGAKQIELLGEKIMDIDLRKLNDEQLSRVLEFTTKLAEQSQQDDLANFGDPDDLAGAETQARDYIKRRKNNVRLIDDNENRAIRKQVRSWLKRKGLIKD